MYTYMKKLIFITFLLGIIFTSCEDDPNINPTIIPTDKYIGNFKLLELGVETENLNISDTVTCHMIAPDNSEISRKCHISKTGDKTIVKFETGLTDGTYRLLYFEYNILPPEGNNNEITTKQYGLGCRIAIVNSYAKVIDEFDKTMQMTGSGTEEDPYIVTCGPHLYNLTLGVKDFYEYEKFNGAYFKQVADISLHDASYYCKHESGWIPIGNSEYPFVGYYDGDGHKITNMYSYQDSLCGVGFFGHITNSSIQNLIIENADISGAVGVGGIAGCLMSVSGDRTTSSIINCKVVNSQIKANNNGIAVGGIAGLIDMYTVGMITQCISQSNTISADYNAGGVVGSSSAYSLTTIDLCKNYNSSVTSNFGGAGGIIGVADTLSITTSSNSGEISGAKKYTEANEYSLTRGVGGICGGSGISYISCCDNSGNVSGHEGVGGIIGSTRLGYTEENGAIYNSTVLRYCSNTGNITGTSSNIGGLCGEAQICCLGSLNNGTVTGTDNIGGIVGHSSISVIHNTINVKEISGINNVAGISGVSNSGVYASCQNYGEITGKGSHSAGVVGLTGNNTMIHYCSNHNNIEGQNSPVAGIVGEIGDPREWSAINIAECVFGSIEIVASFIGPAFAIIEHCADPAKVVKYIMTGVELTIEGVLKIPSTVLFGYGVHHLHNPHHIETIETSIKAELTNHSDSLIREINEIRIGKINTKEKINDTFSPNALLQYSQNIVKLSDYINLSPGNNDHFNTKINDIIHQRAKEIQYINENRETLYTIVGTITLVTTTACAIAATVASGGTAGIVATGMVAGVIGGINSISKGAADYTDNVIIISQCVNTGNISCNNIENHKVGGIAGRIHDRGWIHDCLNTGNGPNDGGCFVGYMGNEFTLTDCLSLANSSTWDGFIGDKSVSLSESSGLYMYGDLDVSDISNINTFSDWNIGTTNQLWSIPSLESGNSFPVPFTSEMTK